jgi:hypothetical protein
MERDLNCQHIDRILSCRSWVLAHGPYLFYRDGIVHLLKVGIGFQKI